MTDHRLSWPSRKVQLLRCGRFEHWQGRFSIEPKDLLGLWAMFPQSLAERGSVPINIAHRPENGTAGKITALSIEDDALWGKVDWEPLGIRAIRERGYCYLSAEFRWPYLLGAALTIRPAIKHLAPVRMEHSGGGRLMTLSESLRAAMAEGQ